MNLSVRHRPRLRIRLRYILAAGAVLFAFLQGPSGLVSLARRKHEEYRLVRDIERLKREIARETRRCDWLSNPDSAALLARQLLGDSVPNNQ
jgi:hypothetical protein